MKIRIMHLITGLVNQGGAENLLLDICKHLDKRKFTIEVQVVCLQGRNKIIKRFEQHKIPVTNLNVQKRRILSYLRIIKLLLKLRNTHIIHTHLIHADILGGIIGRIFNKCVISTIHNEPNWGNRGWLIRKLSRYIYRLSSLVITNSHSVKQSLLKANPFLRKSKIVVVHNGIDLRKFKRTKNELDIVDFPVSNNEKTIVIGTVARLDRIKGIENLLLAFEGLCEEFENVKLVIAGDGPLRESLLKMKKDHGLKNAFFLGERSDVPAVLQHIHIFILPSLSEGFGISAVEALAMGLPVIATRTGGIPEVITNNRLGWLVPPNDVSALRKAISDCIKNKNLRIDYKEYRRQHVKKRFTIEKTALELMDIYLDFGKN